MCDITYSAVHISWYYQKSFTAVNQCLPRQTKRLTVPQLGTHENNWYKRKKLTFMLASMTCLYVMSAVDDEMANHTAALRIWKKDLEEKN
jgi:hypothetical protein